MSALAIEPEADHMHGWEDAVRIWQETVVPDGCRVEIIEGIVTVAPPPNWEHNEHADELQRALYPVIPRDWSIHQTLGITIPARLGLFVPDLVVVPKSAARDEGGRVPAGEVKFVAEITSRQNADHDRVEKLHGYASAGVPLYLLLDTHHSGRPTATLYGTPHDGLYTVLDTVKYGEEIHLPAPFDITLDTSVFPGV